MPWIQIKKTTYVGTWGVKDQFFIDPSDMTQVEALLKKLDQQKTNSNNPTKPNPYKGLSWGKIKKPDLKTLKTLGKKFNRKRSADLVRFVNEKCKCDRMDVINLGCKCGGN